MENEGIRSESAIRAAQAEARRREYMGAHGAVGSGTHAKAAPNAPLRRDWLIFVKIPILALFCLYSWQMGQNAPAGLNGFGTMVSLSFFIAAPAFYLLPTIEAAGRKQSNMTSIALVNILLGWTVIGWVVALAWACKKEVPQAIISPALRATPSNKSRLPGAPSNSIADEIAKLGKLRNDGLLTEAEFLDAKTKLLA